VSWRRSAMQDLERHVMRCRRRGESAWLMLALVPGRSRSKGHHLACCYRMSDSVAVARVGRHYRLIALFDDDELDRSVLERRLHGATGANPSVAWARFPDDGVTLEALLHAARAELRSELRATVAPSLAAASTSAAVDGK
jgi:hypothetical protein